jgi:hypothetical protein
MNKYTKILGAGGYGMIVSSDINSNVTKLYYEKDKCGEMTAEYLHFITVFNAFNDNPYPQIMIPEPKKIDNRQIIFGEKEFQCGIEMKRILPLSIMSEYKNGIIHVILKEEYKKQLNKERGREYGEITDLNPSRGFEATGSYIENNILPKLNKDEKGIIESIEDIAYMMGISFTTLFIHAEIYPVDVEYCLGNNDGKVNLVMMDFGMCEFIDYLDSVDTICNKLLEGNEKAVGALDDIYLPSKKDPTFTRFSEGIEYVKSKLTDKKKIELVTSVLSKWE